MGAMRPGPPIGGDGGRLDGTATTGRRMASKSEPAGGPEQAAAHGLARFGDLEVASDVAE